LQVLEEWSSGRIAHTCVSKSPFLSVISEYDKVGRKRLEWYDLSYWIGKLGLTVSPKEILNSFGNRILPR
jgi:hypothetical protein